MAYLLGSITLPNPKEFVREQVETSVMHEMIDGTSKRDITRQKERYILTFRNLTQAQASSIMSEYNLQTTRTFEVTETNLTIAATSVHIAIDSRQYNSKGGDYREDITLVLTEVS